MDLTINQKIQLIRTYFGMNQTQFGEKVGLSLTAVSNIEKGAKPRRPTLERIQQRLGIDLATVRLEWQAFND